MLPQKNKALPLKKQEGEKKQEGGKKTGGQKKNTFNFYDFCPLLSAILINVTIVITIVITIVTAVQHPDRHRYSFHNSILIFKYDII